MIWGANSYTLQFSKRTDTYASLDFFSPCFFFYLSQNCREEKLQCGLVLFGLLTATGKTNLHWAFVDGVKHSFILEWEAGKKLQGGYLENIIYLFPAALFSHLLDASRDDCEIPHPCELWAKNLTSPSYTNWECDTRRYAAFWKRRFSSQ